MFSKLKDIIKNSNHIVFFGGAGVSTESNIPDFRSEKGLYNAIKRYNHSPEEILSGSFFYNNTDIFYEYYKQNMIYRKAKPNDAHIALAKLEKIDKLKAIVTQNIDGLHQKSGSKMVFELHGSINKNYCVRCNKYFSLDDIMSQEGIPYCDECNNIIKPAVVLYEEGLDEEVIKNAIKHISKADTLIVGGTSLVVYPAAGLINYFNGKNLVLINKTVTAYDNKADMVIHDSIGKVLKQVINE